MTPDKIDELLRKLDETRARYVGGNPERREDYCDSMRAIVAEWAAGQSQPILDALNTVEQALREVQHAQSVGASWYTRGSSGLYGQVAMWVRKGFEAIAAAKTVLK